MKVNAIPQAASTKTIKTIAGVKNINANIKLNELANKCENLLNKINETKAKITSLTQSFQYIGWKEKGKVKVQIKELNQQLQRLNAEYTKSNNEFIEIWMNNSSGKAIKGIRMLSP